MPVDIYSLEPRLMGAFLERRRAMLAFASEMNLADNLGEILRKANEFVPSAAGSILLDNPLDKQIDRRLNRLTFVTAFGEKAETLIGCEIPANQGIGGHVYIVGESYHAATPREDRFFFSGVDELIDYTTHSLIAVPIRIEQEVCGVLELINRQGSERYSREDLNLLTIFAGYISVSIQNILDGRRAQELAKRDNLTGLFNDHYLHVAMSRTIERSLAAAEDLAVIFLDLDYFKSVNDTWGHLAGSQVLREVGHLLKAILRNQPQSVAARYGGDEFVLVIPNMDVHAATELSENIRSSINSALFCAKPGEIQPDAIGLTGITCSIGIATLASHVVRRGSVEECKSSLLRLADSAMYVAKNTGRNRTAVAELAPNQAPAAET